MIPVVTDLTAIADRVTPSADWYRSNPKECLHPTLRCMSDALEYSKDTGETIYMVYLREIYQLDKDDNVVSLLVEYQRAKVGKGKIENGDIARDPTAGGSDGILNTLAVIPCANEVAYGVLEELFHKYLKFEGRWIKPISNDHGKYSGTEWFNKWPTEKLAAINEFNTIGRFITSDTDLGRSTFKPRYYQAEAAHEIANWWTHNNNSDFYLMLKPRAGKNSTALLSLVLRAITTGKQEEALMLSQWPSAFSGMMDDCNRLIFDINSSRKSVTYVNTQLPDWRTHLETARKSDACAIVIMSSMQSIDKNSIEDTDAYDASKVQDLLKLQVKTVIFDESDYGLRTANSITISDAFKFEHRIWMSGTDLYAMRNLIVDGNHYCYNLLDEIRDVRAKKIEERPLIKKSAMKATDIPYMNDLDPSEMNASGLSRRMRVLLKTTLDRSINDEELTKNTKVIWDDRDKLWLDTHGRVIEFVKKSEVEKLFDYTYEWDYQSGWKGPLDHDHIFWTMPSVSSVYAMHNLIRLRKANPKSGTVKHEPLVANSYNNPSSIEYEVNCDCKKYGKTIFLTVGKMLRGAKAPWSAVVRWDDYMDVKVGLQIELRGQNTTDPRFYVYDFNIWRAASTNYEIIRGSSKTGADVDSIGQELYNLIPLMRKGEFTSELMTWEDIVTAWQADRICEGFKSRSLINDLELKDNEDILLGVNPLNDNDKGTRDPLAGKNGAAPSKTGSRTTSLQDPLKELRSRALTISKNLPLLIFVTDGKWRELHKLFDQVEDDLLEQWLDHLGIVTTDLDQIRTQLPNIFNTELMNHQLFIAAMRFENGEFDAADIAEFARPKLGDVSVPESLVNELLNEIPGDFWI